MEPEISESTRFKIKIGLFLGYNGQKFQGMQYQRQHANTIQNILHSVLVEQGFVLPTNASELRRIHWSRAGRTDKKVHALCNGISLKIEINPKFVIDQTTKQIDYKRIMFQLNDQLPMDIKILALRKVGKNFDMRHDADTRVYNYIIPSRLFQQFSKFKENLPIQGQELDKLIQRLNELVKFYLGTHNFYNFTKKHKQTDPRCDRYMIKMFVQKVQATTVKTILKQCQKDPQNQYQSFIRFTLVGQSFIYHQIRKMIGLLLKIFSQQLQGKQTIQNALTPEQYDVYLTPGQGLYLNRMTFESYNTREHVKQKLQFTQEQQERIKQYRAYLQTKIIKHEIEQKLFSDWLTNRSIFQIQEENNNKDEQQSENDNDEKQKQKQKQKQKDGDDENQDGNQQNGRNKGKNKKNNKWINNKRKKK